MSEPQAKIRIYPPQPKSAGAEIEETLYEVRKKIYPRAVTGVFARWRWTIVFLTQAVFYGLPWLVWNGRQAVLFDLVARKDGTRVKFSHCAIGDFEDDAQEMYANGWADLLGVRLRAHLEPAAKPARKRR